MIQTIDLIHIGKTALPVHGFVPGCPSAAIRMGGTVNNPHIGFRFRDDAGENACLGFIHQQFSQTVPCQCAAVGGIKPTGQRCMEHTQSKATGVVGMELRGVAIMGATVSRHLL